MTGGLLHRLDGVARHAAPGAVTLLLVLVGVTPTRIPYYGPVAPLLPLAAVYYWMVQRPDLMPFTLVFAVGLLHDILSDAPIGAHAFVFLLCAWQIRSQRRFLVGKPFVVLWLGFILVAAAASVLEWVILSVYNLSLVPLRPVAVRAVLTMAAFPLLAWIFIQMHRGFLRQPE